MAETAKKSSSTSKKTAPAKKMTATKAVATKSTAKPAVKKTVAKKIDKSAGSKPAAKKTDTKSNKARGSEKLYLHYREPGRDEDFEERCLNYLNARPGIYGRGKRTEKGPDDGGVDIICQKYEDEYDDEPSQVFFVQVKNTKVGVDVVRALLGVMSTHGKRYGDEDTEILGVIMTSLTATADAKKEGKLGHIKFIEGPEIENDKKSRTKLR